MERTPQGRLSGISYPTQDTNLREWRFIKMEFQISTKLSQIKQSSATLKILKVLHLLYKMLENC